MYTSCKIWKIPVFFFFFSQHWTYFGPNFAPRTTPTLLFLADFQRNMLGDTININNLCCNPSSSEKKLFKTPKNCFFGPNLHRKGLIMGHAQGGIFFSRKKADHQLSESFYFIKISHFDWVMNLSLTWVMSHQ